MEKLIPFPPANEKRYLLSPENVDSNDLEERKTIPPVDQLDPGSVAPDAISSVQKRKTIPPADQLDPGSVSPDSVCFSLTSPIYSDLLTKYPQDSKQ